MRLRVHGFNMGEVMVAFMLIVVALFALVSMQAHSMRSQTGSREAHQASVIASSLLSQAEAALEADFTSNPSQPLAPVTDHPDYQAVVTVTDISAELKRIEVDVSWIEGPRAAHQNVETIVAAPY